MDDLDIRRDRAQNIWSSFSRKFEPVAQATRLEASPDFGLAQIGGLDAAKEEIQTFALAATDPDVYQRWGTHPPTGLLLIGQRGVGKRLLARSLATLTQTSFLDIAVPRLVLEVIHRGGNVGELVTEWVSTLAEMPPITAVGTNTANKTSVVAMTGPVISFIAATAASFELSPRSRWRVVFPTTTIAYPPRHAAARTLDGRPMSAPSTSTAAMASYRASTTSP